MRMLEALRILEDATLECKVRNIDTPEVKAALDLLDPYCRPTWFVKMFRASLQRGINYIGLPEFEGQQQMLRVNFGGIYGNVRHLLITRIGRLGGRYCKTKDPAIKAEIDRLNAELAKLPTQWKFVSRRSGEESFSTALPCYFGRMTEI